MSEICFFIDNTFKRKSKSSGTRRSKRRKIVFVIFVVVIFDIDELKMTMRKYTTHTHTYQLKTDNRKDQQMFEFIRKYYRK